MVVLNQFMVLSNHDSFKVGGPRSSACYRTGTHTPSQTLRLQCVFDLNSRMAPETSGGHARVAVKQKEGWLSRWYRARAAQRRRRRPAEPP